NNQATGCPKPEADSSKDRMIDMEKRAIRITPVSDGSIVLLIHNIIPNIKIERVVNNGYVEKYQSNNNDISINLRLIIHIFLNIILFTRSFGRYRFILVFLKMLNLQLKNIQFSQVFQLVL